MGKNRNKKKNGSEPMSMDDSFTKFSEGSDYPPFQRTKTELFFLKIRTLKLFLKFIVFSDGHFRSCGSQDFC